MLTEGRGDIPSPVNINQTLSFLAVWDEGEVKFQPVGHNFYAIIMELIE